MISHEHEMVPDYPIPPYAWHFKCAATGCDYATDSFQIPKEACAACTEKDVEIRRLREALEAPFDAEHITAAVAVAVGPVSARGVRYWLKKAEAGLAAHQAVVRELADMLTRVAGLAAARPPSRRGGAGGSMKCICPVRCKYCGIIYNKVEAALEWAAQHLEKASYLAQSEYLHNVLKSHAAAIRALKGKEGRDEKE